MGRLRVLEIVAEKAPLSLPSPDFLFSLCLKGKTNIWRQASIRGDMSYLLSSLFIIYSLLSLSRIYHYIVISFCWWCLKGKTNICRQASIEGDISIWITHWRLADIDVKQIHQIVYICTIDMLIWRRSLLNLCFCFSHLFFTKKSHRNPTWEYPSYVSISLSNIIIIIIIKHHLRYILFAKVYWVSPFCDYAQSEYLRLVCGQILNWICNRGPVMLTLFTLLLVKVDIVCCMIVHNGRRCYCCSQRPIDA